MASEYFTRRIQRIFLFGSLIFLIFTFSAKVFAQDLHFPQPMGFVNDSGEVLSAQEESELENLLRLFKKQTGNEVVVVTVPDLQGTTIEDYAVRLFEEWKPGKEGEDNGLLLLMSRDDRKVRMEVGYGLEGVLSDGFAGEILDREALPHFREGNIGQGISAAITRVLGVLQGEENIQDFSDREAEETVGQQALGSFLYFLFLFFPIVISWFAGFLGRTKRIWPGGALGAVVGGGIVFFLFQALLFTIGAAVFFGLIGLFFDHMVSKNYAERKRRGLPTDFWHSGGGFWLGGGRGGGFGGGFGGFGGGFSGGGGASRGW